MALDRDDIDLPEDSLFDRGDYERMAEVASTRLGHDILTELEENDQLSQRELEETLNNDADEIPGTLRDLMRVALIKNRRDPTGGREEVYDYYTLTELGRTILGQGVEEGLKRLTDGEVSIGERYIE